MASNAPTPLCLPKALDYPIRIQRLHAKPGQEILKTSPLFSYSYTPKNNNPVPGAPPSDEVVRVWESPIQGKLVSWKVTEGQVLLNSARPVVHILEACTHDVQLHGLCALCGKDLTAVDYTGFSDTSRADISMVHDVDGLRVSLEEANRLETQTTARLLSSKKLSLIVDLDQTIVHATVDPTVGEWLNDPKNPNYSALEGVQKFQLSNHPSGSMEGEPWYYIKMRPGLSQFLKDVAEMYEMHVYTMGTRAYASEVCKIIDPDGGLFGGRILSRDESGSMTRKSLQRLFPCDTSMVVIIDDRQDVWDGSPNLVKVIPYEFFVGIGDINASFLPKKKDLDATPAPSKIASPATPVASSSSSTLDIPVATSEASDSVPALEEAEAENAQALLKQIENRPLSKTHKAHHHNPPAEAEGVSVEHPEGTEQGTSEAPTDMVVDVEKETVDEETDDEEEEAVLVDDDDELKRLFDILRDVHSEFFRDFAKGAKRADVKIIIPSMKQRVLRGVRISFSGVVALGTAPEDSMYWKLAIAYGAKCFPDLTPDTTHLVATQVTNKVQIARKNPRIHIVLPSWLVDSGNLGIHAPESRYYLLPPPTKSTEPHPLPSPISPPFEPNDPKIMSPEDAGNFLSNDWPTVDAEDTDTRDESGKGKEKVERSGSETPSLNGGDVPLDMTEVDWGDAANEVDAFLNETDDDDDLDEGEYGSGMGEDDDDGNETDGSSFSYTRETEGEEAGPPRISTTRKRGRNATDSEDDLPTTASSSNGIPVRKVVGSLTAASVPAAVAIGSPLQKRVKTSRSRTSRLKVSFPPPSEEEASEVDSTKGGGEREREGEGGRSSVPTSRPVALLKGDVDEEAATPNGGGSSEMDSDDEAFFLSMAAEVEQGWSKD